MNKQIESYLPRAINIIIDVGIANDGVVDSRFNGYFSAFGASIIMSGVKPALSFYSNEKVVDDRSKILSAIFALITDIDSVNDVKPQKLLSYYIQNEDDKMVKYKILNAAVALKLAVRTYKLEQI